MLRPSVLRSFSLHCEPGQDTEADLMVHISPGETWSVLIDGETRTVDVVSAAVAPGWWTCRDRETDIHFAARAQWFVARMETNES